jgi:hypothetical protein
MSTFNDNPFQPRMVTDEYVPDQLIAGHLNLVTDTGTITGGAAFKRGTVLGELSGSSVTVTAGGAVSASGGTPGNGAIGVVTADAGAMAGVYQVRIVNPATNAGAFEVIRPDGSVDGDGAVGVAYNGMINFTLADGSTDFVEDDRIPVTVAYSGEGLYTIATAAALDGSATPCAILIDDVDVTGGDKRAGIYLMGQFNDRAVTLGAGITAAGAKAALRKRGIFLTSSISAADPS